MGIEVTKTLTSKKFSSLKPKLSPELLSAIENVEKFEFMTTVQSHVIPLFMGNKDVMCEACTGNLESYLASKGLKISHQKFSFLPADTLIISHPLLSRSFV